MIGPTRKQIAEHFGVTDRCVDMWRERGWLPEPMKFGTKPQSRVRYPANAIQLLEARFRGEQGAQAPAQDA